MPTTNKTPRLPAAAKEFNVGMSTIVELLTAKGFEIANSPGSKLTEDMYTVLEHEYAQDRAAKKKSDEIVLVQRAAAEAKKPAGKKEDAAKKEAAAKPKAAQDTPEEVPAELPTPEAAEPVVAAPAPEAPALPASVPEPVVPEVAPVAEQPAAPEAPKPPVTPEAPAAPIEEPAMPSAPATPEAPVTEPEPEAPAQAERTNPSLPHVVGKIDLSAINQSSRPKKGAAKKGPEKTEAPKKDFTAKPAAPATPSKAAPATPTPVAKAPVALATPPPAPAAPTPARPEEPAKPEHIGINAPKLEGPKILGKIELPAAGDTGRRQRQRIPVAKRPDTFRPGGADRSGTNQQGGNRPGGQQGGNNRPGGGNRPGGQQGGNRGGQQGGNNGQPREIDKKEIQDKIRATQAKLSGGRGGKGKKSSQYRRDKREAMAERRANENSGEGNVIQVTEFISVSELANLLNVSFAEVISKCMGLGIMVSINQRLDAEVIELVANEFGYEVQFINLDQESSEEEEVTDNEEDLEFRAPIVTIMGHVDHGKTSLLDYIRSANVVSGEAGGITQHIGAYRVKTASGKPITFLDTPGHEAFTAMRARGAKVADVAVIVIAADDAIMPQTREAISHAQAANLPMIFALNKMDKEGANPEKIREQLSGMNILVEEWGGKFQSQEISAKKGINIDSLLEKIGLEAELLDLKANPEREGSGSVIEASLDKGRGYVSTILVQNGTLEQGDMIVSGQYYGKIKAMFNERGQRVTSADPSTPVQVLGLNGAPQAGEKFKVYANEDEAKEVATKRSQILREQGIRARKHLTLDEIGRRLALGNFKELPVIIKGDFDGSVEALSDSLQKLSTEEVAINVVHKAVGAITESDVLLATASDAIIIGFQVRPNAQASRLAEQENIEIRNYSIIYDAIAEIKSAMEGLLEPTKEKRTVCNVEVRETFKISGVGTIAGCYVLDGKITRNTRINLIRDGIVVMTGELASLKRFKDDVKEVNAGYECGMNIKNYNDIRVGDIVEGFEEVEVKRTLS
jgi:translation initiation factor IF-2